MARIEDNSNKRKYRIISWPLFLLTFIPNFCMALIIYSEDHTITIVSEKLLKIILNSNIWQPAFGIGMIITMVWSIIERGFKGIGIGLLRVLINISIPVIITCLFDGYTLLSAVIVLPVLLSIWIFIHGPSDKPSRWKDIPLTGGYCVNDGKEQIPLYHISGEKWKGDNGVIYTVKGNGIAYDEYNRSYVVGYKKLKK